VITLFRDTGRTLDGGAWRGSQWLVIRLQHHDLERAGGGVGTDDQYAVVVLPQKTQRN
jgi:hypothetical protein